MTTQSKFYMPLTLHRDAKSGPLVAPFVQTLPLLQEVTDEAVVLELDTGAKPQGLYVFDGVSWRFSMPYQDVCAVIIYGDTVDAYYNQTDDVTLPVTSIIFKNGQLQPGDVITHGPAIYAVRTPPASGPGSGVTSVNGKVGTVSLVAADIPGIATVGRTGQYSDLIGAPAPFTLLAATAAQLGGVKVPNVSNISVAVDGSIDIQPTVLASIASKLSNVTTGGTGNSLVHTVAGGTATLKSVAAGTNITFSDDGQTLTINAAAASVPLATVSVAGIVKIGSGVNVAGDGTISVATYGAATVGTAGLVKPGLGMTVAGDGTLNVTAQPIATATVLGQVKIGANVNVAGDGTISVTLPVAATAGAIGLVKPGTGLTVAADGTLNAAAAAIATTTTLGNVKVGAGLTVAGDGTLAATATNYGPATTLALGVVKVGSGLAVAGDGTLSASAAALATTTTVGVVKIGAGLAVDGAGNVTANIPVATAGAAGIVKPGAGMTVDGAGALSVTARPAATTTTLGEVIVGSGLAVTVGGTLSVAPATAGAIGAIKPGTGLTVTADGTLNASATPLVAATTTTLGGVIVGSGISVAGDGTISVTPYTLPAATTLALGGVIVGSGISVAGDGTISVTPYSLPTASATVLGGVKVGSGLAVAGDGTLSATGAATPATTTTLGSVIVGSGLAVDGAGVLSATGEGGTGSTLNPASRYAALATAGNTVWIYSSSDVKSGLAWTRTTTNLVITDPGHGHSVGDRALVRNTNVPNINSLITAADANTFTVDTTNTGAASGSAAAYSMGFTFAHNAAAPSITGGTLTPPSNAAVNLISMRFHMGANTRSGTVYSLTLLGSSANGAGDNTSIDDLYVPLIGVRQDSSTMAAVGATLAYNQAAAGFNVYQLGALPVSTTIGIYVQFSF